MWARIKNEISANFRPKSGLEHIEGLRTVKIRSQDDRDFLKHSEEALGNLEIIRLEKLRAYEARKKLGIPAAAILAPLCIYIDYFLLIWTSSGSDSGGAGVTFIVLGLLYRWVTKPRREYAKSYKKEILPKIAKLFGDFRYNIKGKAPMNLMLPSKIVPRHDRYKSEDYFTGEYKGIQIEFSEIDLAVRRRRKNRTSYQTVFKGLAVLLDTRHKRFFGHTLIDQNKSKISEWFKERSSTLQRAEMVDPEFEAIFDVYTNDQVEARYLIDPIMIERLKGLYDEYDGEKMAAAFYDNKMLILIASKHNHFEPSNIYVPAISPDSILNMKKEIGEILSIVDKLSLYDPEEVHKKE